MRRGTSLAWVTLLVCALGMNQLPVLAESAAEARDKGEMALESEDYDTAIESLTRAKALDPKDARSRAALAEAFRLCKRYSEAESELQQLMQMQPSNLQWKRDMASLLRESGKFRQASGVYQELIAANPNDLQALMGMAICLEGSEDIGTAREYYQRIVQQAPRTMLGAQAKTRLDRLSQATSAIQTNKFFSIDPDWGERGLGWWDLRKMPIHVYIDSGSDVQGYRERMRSQMAKAMETWSMASRGKIRFIIDAPDMAREVAWRRVDVNGSAGIEAVKNSEDMPPDPISASIHVHWAENLRAINALGLAWTSPLISNSSVIKKAHLWITTNRLSDGSQLPSSVTVANSALFDAHDRMIQEVMVHEFGHALGLPHSPNPNDIMAAGIYAMNSADMAEGRTLSVRDVASLAEHYGGFAGAGMPAHIIAQDKQGNWMYEMQKKEQEGKGGTSASGSDSSSSSTGTDSKPASDNKPAGDTTTGETSTGETKAADGEKKADDGKTDAKPADTKATDSKTDDKKAADGKASGDKKADEKKGDEKTDEKKADEEKKDDSLLKHVKAEPYDPLKDAMFDMSCQRYDSCATKLLKIVAGNPKHAQARYLLAVTYVMLRKYEQAVQQYAEVIKLVPPNSQLSRMAAEGLKKIGH